MNLDTPIPTHEQKIQSIRDRSARIATFFICLMGAVTVAVLCGSGYEISRRDKLATRTAESFRCTLIDKGLAEYDSKTGVFKLRTMEAIADEVRPSKPVAPVAFTDPPEPMLFEPLPEKTHTADKKKK